MRWPKIPFDFRRFWWTNAIYQENKWTWEQSPQESVARLELHYESPGGHRGRGHRTLRQYLVLTGSLHRLEYYYPAVCSRGPPLTTWPPPPVSDTASPLARWARGPGHKCREPWSRGPDLHRVSWMRLSKNKVSDSQSYLLFYYKRLFWTQLCNNIKYWTIVLLLKARWNKTTTWTWNNLSSIVN